jgi:hypothetical protein
MIKFSFTIELYFQIGGVISTAIIDVFIAILLIIISVLLIVQVFYLILLLIH